MVRDVGDTGALYLSDLRPTSLGIRGTREKGMLHMSAVDIKSYCTWNQKLFQVGRTAEMNTFMLHLHRYALVFKR